MLLKKRSIDGYVSIFQQHFLSRCNKYGRSLLRSEQLPFFVYNMGDNMEDNKQKALSAALAQIERQFGKGSVMRMGDDNVIRDIEAISTGSLGLDIALGIGGLPKGRIVEIYGPESSGKTTLSLQVIAECQKKGVLPRLLTQSTLLIPVMQQNLVLMLMNYSCPNLIPVSKP